MHYDWRATFVFVGTLVAVTVLGKVLVFRVPAFRRMRALNDEADERKLERPRFRRAVEASRKTGLWTNAAFYLAVLPWCLTLEPRPSWRSLVDVAAVLMLYDLLYYLTHRFVFHGPALRKVHALHHQARTPTYVDAFYVHPLETFIGLALFLGSIPLVAAIGGGPLGAVSMALATLTFTQLNTLNHTFVDLPRFPFRTVDRITSLHAAHHVDMQRGNYATLTMLYDWLFGTLEEPVSRSTP